MAIKAFLTATDGEKQRRRDKEARPPGRRTIIRVIAASSRSGSTVFPLFWPPVCGPLNVSRDQNSVDGNFEARGTPWGHVEIDEAEGRVVQSRETCQAFRPPLVELRGKERPGT